VQLFICAGGARGPPPGALFNRGGWGPGVLRGGAWGAWRPLGFPRRRAGLGAPACIAVFGLGHVAAGLYSCDPGCPLEGASWQATVHDRVSLTAFVAGVAGIALWARVFRRLPAWRPLAGYSAVSSLIAFGLLVGLGLSMEARAFTGAWQRLFIGTLYLWCAVVGVRMSRFASPRR
jgi:hypothetical protein